jgi:hypothetical protein
MFLVVGITDSTTDSISYWNLSRFCSDIASAMGQDGNNCDLFQIGALTAAYNFNVTAKQEFKK